MKNQWIKTTALTAMAIIMVAGMNAQPSGRKAMGPSGHGNGPGGKGQNQACGQTRGDLGARMTAILDLSEEQQEQLSTLRVKHYKTMKPLKAEMVELKARERTLMSQEVIDVKAVNMVIDQRTELSNKTQKKQLENRLACREVLTEKQRMKLDHARRTAGNKGAHRGNGKRAHPHNS